MPSLSFITHITVGIKFMVIYGNYRKSLNLSLALYSGLFGEPYKRLIDYVNYLNLRGLCIQTRLTLK